MHPLGFFAPSSMKKEPNSKKKQSKPARHSAIKCNFAGKKDKGMNVMNRLAVAIAAMVAAAQAPAQGKAGRPSRHYAERVAQFARAEAIDSCDIVMLGNSLTENGGDWSALLGVDGVVNRGIIGDDAEGMAARLGQILPGRPKAIFLMVGINDISHGLTAEQVAGKAKGLIEAIRKGSPSTRLYVQSLLPIDESDGRWKLLAGKSATIAEVNSMIEEHCRVNGISFINLYPRFVRRGTATLRRELSRDGLHLSPQGYKLWAFELGRYVGSLK